MNKTLLILAVTMCAAASLASAADREVAYVEEITYEPDGTEHIERYKPQDQPVTVPVQQQPVQRGLNDIEKQEIARLEMDFAQGRITETEYNQRKRDIYRSTFVNGAPEDDGALNYSGTF